MQGQFLDSPIPWFISGAIIFGGLAWLILWAKSRNIAIQWYSWVIGAVGVALIFFAAQNFWAALEEFETRASWFYLLLFGLPGLLLIAIAFRLTQAKNASQA